MKVSDLLRGMRIAMRQSEQGTIMTRLVYKDRNKQIPGSKPGSKPNSKLDKRTSDAMGEIEGPAERDGGAATDNSEDDPPAPEGGKRHVS